MDITFKNDTAKKQFSSEHKNKWKYPKQVQEKLVAAENFIKSAVTLEDVILYPPFHFHSMHGDRKGEWSIYLGKKTGYRVTFIPCDESGKKIVDGDVVARCKTIKIIMVTEVSNHYE